MGKNKKYYPSADEWMWDYCTFLGSFEDSKGDKYDLGILLDNGNNSLIEEWSLAVVYGNEPGNYISGGPRMHNNSPHEFAQETIKRAKKLNLI